jgi:predicted nucleic acid-binding protein
MFWDSSALVPTFLPATHSVTLIPLLRADRRLAMWWGSPVECQSAVYRRHRTTPLRPEVLEEIRQRLTTMVGDADVVAPTTGLRDGAGRLLAAHPLRAGDALQLAAALVWCDGAPASETFVCLDARLRDAARAEGFAILPA